MCKTKLFITIIAVILMMSACKKESLMSYSGGVHLQFGPDSSYIYNPQFDMADTLKASTFYYKPADVTLDTIYFDIYAIGGLSDHDRSFKLEQTNLSDPNKAVAGVHYIAFSDPAVSGNYVIKAGRMHAKVPVVMMRDPILKTSTVRLAFQIVANDYFLLGESKKLWRKLDITDRLIKPANWDNFKNSSLGAYSSVKQKFMIDNTMQPWDEAFIAATGNDTALLTYWMNLLKAALASYNKANPANPLKDETGAAVVFP